MPVYVSDLLTATAAPVNAVPTATRSWQWLRGSTAISGATSSTYTAVTADIGATIAASQIETNVAGSATATSAPTEVIQAFDPIRLFSASEPGVWYDPNDITTLFKGPITIEPVTTPGDTVWTMLDKSKGGPGPDLVLNGNFANGSTDWTLSGGATVSGGQLVFADGVFSEAYQAPAAHVSGKGYIYEFDLTITSGTVTFRPWMFSNDSAQVYSTSGRKRFFAVTTGSRFGVLTSTGVGVRIDNISVREVPGNHATQPTTASQPIYGIVPAGGRRNLLLWTEDLRDTAAAGEARPWRRTNATVTPNAAVAPDGTLTATRIQLQTGSAYSSLVDQFPIVNLPSATVTFSAYVWCASGTQKVTLGITQYGVLNHYSGYKTITTTPTRIDFTVTFSAGGSGTDVRFITGGDGIGADFFVWHPQFEVSSTATNYQRVTTQYDVTEAGVASLGYLFFDGSGDFMSTGTITPGTDKAQVFTGVRRFADSLDVIAEFSGNWNALDGSFLFWGGTSMATGTGPGFNSGARGNAAASASQAGISPTTFTPPVTAVLTVTHDISGDLSSVRGNGVAGVNGTADKGTGNFLAYPLYIGRRSNGDFPLEGQLFPLIVRFGPNLTTARISATESWVASKTPGVTL